MDVETQRVIEFIIEADKLKAVIRKTKPAGFERYENSAEHSWQVCLLATLLANRAARPIDIQRVVEILLVHDIPEIDASDQIVYAPHDAARFAAEKHAAERVFGILPEPQASWCLSRWEEYEARESDEAVFAYAVDRMMPLLHNIENDGQSWRENDVPMARVLEVNSAIGEAMPEVWDHVRGVLGERFGVSVGDDAST
jgi:putative hydrolase of HD superfamily